MNRFVFTDFQSLSNAQDQLIFFELEGFEKTDKKKSMRFNHNMDQKHHDLLGQELKHCQRHNGPEG